MGNTFSDHSFVSHGKGEYVRGDVHTNTIGGYFSVFKRGMKGVYQHCRKKHLHRYAAEFEFRYNNRVAHGIDDSQRALNVLSCVTGKRLTYKLSERKWPQPAKENLMLTIYGLNVHGDEVDAVVFAEKLKKVVVALRGC